MSRISEIEDGLLWEKVMNCTGNGKTTYTRIKYTYGTQTAHAVLHSELGANKVCHIFTPVVKGRTHTRVKNVRESVL